MGGNNRFIGRFDFIKERWERRGIPTFVWYDEVAYYFPQLQQSVCIILLRVDKGQCTSIAMAPGGASPVTFEEETRGPHSDIFTEWPGQYNVCLVPKSLSRPVYMVVVHEQAQKKK